MTLYDSKGKYRPDEWIIGKDQMVRPTKKVRKQGQGIYMPLDLNSRCRLRILKTELGCETWQECIDRILADYNGGNKK